MPAPMAIFDLLQLEALLVRKIGSHFPVRFRHDLVDAPAGVPSYFFQLRGHFIDDRRYFGDLFRRQAQFCPKPFPHPLTYHPSMVGREEEMPRVRRAQESARHSASEENQEKTGD